MALLKKRQLDFKHLDDFVKAGQYVELLLDQSGVMDVSLDTTLGKIEYTYDLQKTDFKTIQSALTEVGYTAPSTFWARMKTSWTIYTEQNERDNYNAPEQPCCSHPDEILNKSKK